ncbi:uncharacterized protein F5147DRAFT_655572 [Suillus discolor]|uniref:Uncharacterized protein n=1 Tax=Suillus discolor TaxID=1912936 RepID=A0A9P7F191_9AGAM|nr:uncharacterized protein F5147DRAFT_655572 [Suillus discolor]KAG2100458.1 hypothetical protein F5147DRAFT_655572 [Suillus discolor]
MSQIAGRKEAGCEDTKIDVKRPKLERPDAEPMFLRPPFRQTPGPVTASQNYIRNLILERWEAEVKACEQAKKLQLLEIAPGPAISILQASIRRLVIERWDVEVKRCEEAKRAQLLETRKIVMEVVCWELGKIWNGRIFAYLTVDGMAGRIFAYLTVDGMAGQDTEWQDGMTRVSTPHGSSSKKKPVPGCDLAHGLSLNEAVTLAYRLSLNKAVIRRISTPLPINKPSHAPHGSSSQSTKPAKTCRTFQLIKGCVVWCGVVLGSSCGAAPGNCAQFKSRPGH